jgi:hypothetical protein
LDFRNPVVSFLTSLLIALYDYTTITAIDRHHALGHVEGIQGSKDHKWAQRMEAEAISMLSKAIFKKCACLLRPFFSRQAKCQISCKGNDGRTNERNTNPSIVIESGVMISLRKLLMVIK